jgi:hypothetical protein
MKKRDDKFLLSALPLHSGLELFVNSDITGERWTLSVIDLTSTRRCPLLNREE